MGLVFSCVALFVRERVSESYISVPTFYPSLLCLTPIPPPFHRIPFAAAATNSDDGLSAPAMACLPIEGCRMEQRFELNFKA